MKGFSHQKPWRIEMTKFLLLSAARKELPASNGMSTDGCQLMES
jgi:hypothetical protein